MHALRRRSTADRLAGAAGLVAAIAAILGFIPGVDRDTRPLVVQSNRQDFATLLVGLPVLGPLTLLDITVVGLAALSLALAAGALLSIMAFAATDGPPLDVVQIAIFVAATAVGAALSFTALVPPVRAAVSPNRPSGAMQGNQKGQS